jgi:starvation-inducible DNA-binding protein
MTMDIGLQKKDRKVITDALSRVLADTFILYIKTHGFHWNVTGSNFYSLHNFFKELYENLIEGGDTIAERIRSLGNLAPSSFSEFYRLSAIKEETHQLLEATDMVRQLALDNELIIRRMKEVFDIAETNSDCVTADMMSARIEFHSLAAWKLRSYLE